MIVEVVTAKRDWTLIDSAEPCDPTGAPETLRTLWEDSEQHLTGVARGAVYVNGKLTRVFESKAEVNAYCAEVE